jgi:hypothetical protein
MPKMMSPLQTMSADETKVADAPTVRAPLALQLTSPLTLKQFILRLLICLPIAFIAWHFLAQPIAWALSYLVDVARAFFLSRTVGAIEVNAGMIIFPIRADASSFGGKVVELLTEIDPRQYTYGAPVFAAMMVAAGAKIRWLLLGLTLLLPFQAWGVFFDLLKQIAFPTVEGMPKNLGFDGMPREFIALGYQFGVLILPMLVPVILAATFARERVKHLLRLDY